MQQAVMDFRLFDPSGEVEEQFDDVRVQSEVRPNGAVPDVEALERDRAVRPYPGMPAQDRTWYLMVVLVEPILGPEGVPLQPGGAGMVEVVGHDLGRDVTLPVPSGLLAQLLVLAAEILLQDVRTWGMSIQTAWISMSGVVRALPKAAARTAAALQPVQRIDPVAYTEREGHHRPLDIDGEFFADRIVPKPEQLT